MIVARQKNFSFLSRIKETFLPSKDKTAGIRGLTKGAARPVKRQIHNKHYKGCCTFSPVSPSAITRVKEIRPGFDVSPVFVAHYFSWVETMNAPTPLFPGSTFYVFDFETMETINNLIGKFFGRELLVVGASSDFTSVACIGSYGFGTVWRGENGSLKCVSEAVNIEAAYEELEELLTT